jgi:hypothetical protein
VSKEPDQRLLACVGALRRHERSLAERDEWKTPHVIGHDPATREPIVRWMVIDDVYRIAVIDNRGVWTPLLGPRRGPTLPEIVESLIEAIRTWREKHATT